MTAIPLPVSTFPGLTPQEGAGRLINVRAEALGENARASAVRHRVPGLKAFGTSSESGFRGSHLNGSTLYVAFEDTVVSFTSSGGASAAVDGLDGAERVYFARNNKRPTNDILILADGDLFTLSGSTIASLGDADVPSASGLVFLDGYFFVTTLDGRCFASGLNAATFGSNDFITAEAKNDVLYRPVAWSGHLLLCGAGSIEVWDGDQINVTGFPFNRTVVIQRGIIGAKAIAGFEEGFNKGLLFVGDDNSVYHLVGFAPEKVSPPDLDRLIEAVADKETLDACVYTVGGHPKWVLSCDDWTWEFDLNTQKWNERKSYQQNRWRGVGSFYAFGKWLCGDTETGNILEITHGAQDEAGNPLIAEVWSAPVHAFPSRMRCSRADFDFSVGVGSVSGGEPNETDPVVEISYSDDGGYSFSNSRPRPLGRRGKTKTRITLFNNGMTGAQGRIWKIRMSDPRHFGLMAGDMTAQAVAT
jgi:hypothetical protein